MLLAVFRGELIDKFMTIFNKYIKALFINHCDVIHSIFISVLVKLFRAIINRNELYILLENRDKKM